LSAVVVVRAAAAAAAEENLVANVDAAANCTGDYSILVDQHIPSD
jgi:hypothetical protein